MAARLRRSHCSCLLLYPGRASILHLQGTGNAIEVIQDVGKIFFLLVHVVTFLIDLFKSYGYGSGHLEVNKLLYELN